MSGLTGCGLDNIADFGHHLLLGLIGGSSRDRFRNHYSVITRRRRTNRRDCWLDYQRRRRRRPWELLSKHFIVCRVYPERPSGRVDGFERRVGYRDSLRLTLR